MVTSEKGYLIVEPDLLLTSTAISGTSWCPRKIVLNHRFKGGEGANRSMLIGCIMHELFQVLPSLFALFLKPKFQISVKHMDPSSVTKDWLLTQWRENISSHVMEAFVALNFSPKAFETELVPYAEVTPRLNLARRDVLSDSWKTKKACGALGTDPDVFRSVIGALTD